MAERNLTDVYKKTLDEADDILERAFNEASGKAKVLREGRDPPEAGSTACLRCNCGGFVARTGSGHSLKCQRFGCGHSFFSHDVF